VQENLTLEFRRIFSPTDLRGYDFIISDYLRDQVYLNHCEDIFEGQFSGLYVRLLNLDAIPALSSIQAFMSTHQRHTRRIAHSVAPHIAAT
jgi:hypothetical protein